MVILNKHPVYHNQNGFAIVTVVFVLAFITLAGVMMIQTTNNELQISTNDQIYKSSFYAAEAAKAYVMINSDLYGSENIDGARETFPDPNDDPDDLLATQLLAANSSQSFNGTVEYLSPAEPPRGSGFQAGKYRAHRYLMTCNGLGPRGSKIQIEAGFYRIGF
jgi:Tfp pilus assembly protein PilX